MRLNIKNRWKIFLPILALLGAAFVCDVDPGDSRVPPVLYWEVNEFVEFYRALIRSDDTGVVIGPLVYNPQDATSVAQAGSTVEIQGLSRYESGGEVVIYSVYPNPDMTGVVEYFKDLGSAVVNPDTFEWEAEIVLDEYVRYFAARFESEEGLNSAFSNIIYVKRHDPAALVITSPGDENMLNSNTISLEGTGEPGIGLVLLQNNQNIQATTSIEENGSWTFRDVPILLPGFDSASQVGNTFTIRFTVRAEATGQEESVTVEKVQPVLSGTYDLEGWLAGYGVKIGDVYGNGQCTTLVDAIVDKPGYGLNNSCYTYLLNQGLEGNPLGITGIRTLNRCDVLCLYRSHSVVVLGISGDEITYLEQNFPYYSPVHVATQELSELMKEDVYLIPSNGCNPQD